jgi:DNA modification methylase
MVRNQQQEAGKLVNVINQSIGKNYAIWNADTVEVTPTLPENSVDEIVYSPPFKSLYVYSDSPRDMGNNDTDGDFMEHYKILLAGLYKILRPGRVCVVHTKEVPIFKWKAGYSGISDFPGELVRAHIEAGFIYGGRITIWLDPVTEMQRTNAHRLLYHNFTDSAEVCAPGLPDYLLIFRKPGERTDKDYVAVKHDEPVETWQQWASPTWKETLTEEDGVLRDEAQACWHEIKQTETLNVKGARDERDEKHVCPMALPTLDRIIRMWSNPGEIVYDPFTGIGSTGYKALQLGRRFAGCELKPAYFKAADKNLRQLDAQSEQPTLFSWSNQ